MTFTHPCLKLDDKSCKEKVLEELKKHDIDAEATINSVSIKQMQLKWLKADGKDFLDLVKILNDSRSQDIMKTSFVRCLLYGNWEKYYQKIKWTQFIPYVAYLFSMTNFFALVLLSDYFEKPRILGRILYFPFWGFCAFLGMN